MSRPTVELDVSVIQKSDKAALVTLDIPETAVWLPLSQITLEETIFPGIHHLTLPEWLAEKEGLI